MHEHYKYPVYKSIFKPLLFWNEIERNIIDNYTTPKKYNKNIEVNEIDELLNKQIKNYSKLTKENLIKTLTFLFKTYREFLFISIRDNNINGYHIYKYDNQNDWHQDLKTFNGQYFKNFYYEYLKKLKRQFIKYEEPTNWASNNCILQMSDWSRKEGMPDSYIKEIFGSGNKVLSYRTVRNQLNKKYQPESAITYKQVSRILRNNRDIFTRVSPIEVGSHKWFDVKFLDKKNYSKESQT